MLPGPRATRRPPGSREQQVEGLSALLGPQSSRDCSPHHLPQRGLKGLLVRGSLRPSLAQAQPMQGPACREQVSGLNRLVGSWDACPNLIPTWME